MTEVENGVMGIHLQRNDLLFSVRETTRKGIMTNEKDDENRSMDACDPDDCDGGTGVCAEYA